MPVSTGTASSTQTRKHDIELLMECLDLTSLNEDDNEASISRLCHAALSSPVKPAAVCVYPAFVKLCRKQLKDSGIKIVTVVNFPSGRLASSFVVAEIKQACIDGADEIDLVWNYEAFLKGSCGEAIKPISVADKILHEFPDVTLKVILETAALTDKVSIQRATRLAIGAGADMVTTSTGKSEAGGATPEAVLAMLEALKEIGGHGIKVSGDVKTLSDALGFLSLIRSVMWVSHACPNYFRIEASGLLDVLRKEYNY